MTLEDAKTVLKKEHLCLKIFELLFLLRETPEIACEFWFLVQE
jgi:hypothetical protein